MTNSSYIGSIVRLWALGSGAVLLAIMAVTSLNTLAFAASRMAEPLGLQIGGLPGYEDFVSLSIAVAALGFLPWCQWRRGHIAIDFLMARLPARVGQIADSLWLALLAATALFLAYWLGIGMLEAKADSALSPVLGWPRWPFFAPGILSMLLWAVVCLTQLVGRPSSEGMVQ
ncbi:MAG: TRAP transporter small permease [Pseudomonadota bacterium]